MKFKRTKRVTALLVAVLALSLLLAACGSMSSYDAGEYYGEEYATDDSGIALKNSNNNYGKNSAGNPVEIDGETIEQKIIKNVNISAETETFDKATEQLEEKLNSVGGYVENVDYDGNSYSYAGYRSATYVVRVPADRLDQFMDGISDIFKIYKRNERQQNITAQYVDVESRLKSMETEQDALFELLQRANTVSEILEIQDRLSQVRGSIESYKGQLKVYDSQVAYSTVEILLREVRLVSPDADSGFFTRAWEQLRGSFIDISDGAVEFGVWFIGAIPYFAIIAAVVWLAVFIIRRSIARSAVKAKKKKPVGAADNVAAGGEENNK